MGANIDSLKSHTKKLLSQEALVLWETIEWDEEEVGNIKIGFLSLDPNTRPGRIAKFINKRIVSKNLNLSLADELREKWVFGIKEKYKDQIPVAEINKFRDTLVKTFGNKIVPGVSENLTQEEIDLRELYKLLTKMIYDSCPEVKRIDFYEIILFKIKNFFKNIFFKLKNSFWVILLILIFLAVIKYLLS